MEATGRFCKQWLFPSSQTCTVEAPRPSAAVCLPSLQKPFQIWPLAFLSWESFGGLFCTQTVGGAPSTHPCPACVQLRFFLFQPDHPESCI